MADYGGYTRDAKELAIMQSYPLDMKIALTRNRIYEWVNQFGEDGVVVSFSGGKDSTVLLHLVRTYFPDVKAVFSNTGLEYPEIQRFVKSFDNVDIVTPKMRFDEVISTYGYPLISKEVAEAIYYARRIRTPDEHTNRREALSGNLAGRSQCVQVERERERQVPQQSERTAGMHSAWANWPDEPGMDRVVDRLPDRVDRLKCLGNAVVPQQFYMFFEAIARIETGGDV